jgi:hypothetical protein
MGNQKWIIQRNRQHRANKTQDEDKQKKICVGHHHMQANTNNVNMKWALLQTTGACTPSFWEDKLHSMDNILFYTVTDRNIASSFPPVVCRSAHIMFTLFVFACMWWCPTHIFFWLSSSCVLLALCCRFLWIIHFWLPIRYSLTFI